MTEVAAGQPFYDNPWLAAGSILVTSMILSVTLMFLVMAVLWMVRWIWRRPELRLWIAVGIACSVPFIAIVLFVHLSPPQQSECCGLPDPQILMQQRLAQDEQALDKGVLTYAALPTLKADLPTTLTVTVTDLGKHPKGLITSQDFSQETGMVVYPHNVTTGGIVGLHLSCGTNVYCQALNSTKQVIIGTGTSQSWSWNLTPLRPGPTSVTITATTFDENTDIVLAEEVVPISLHVEQGPWWAALDDSWHTMTSFATTTAGLITTIGGAVAVIAGGMGWIRRHRSRKAQPEVKRDTQPKAETEASAIQEALPKTEGTPET